MAGAERSRGTRHYAVLHLFAGMGGGALGFSWAQTRLQGVTGGFRNLAGIDCDPQACSDYERWTGEPSVCLDLFSRDDYEAFHGRPPPEGWREVLPQDIRTACRGEAPDVVFLSPPCKGLSSLLPGKAAASRKYQALNRLTVRGVWLTLEAFGECLPRLILFENVPRITTRGKSLLRQIRAMLGTYGYVFHESTHDCGELGGLGQRRRRYLLIARHPGRQPYFVYRPKRLPLRTIGDVVGPLPLPEAPGMGPLHRLPRLKWRTWVRLAMIPKGGDWRDLQKVAPGQYRLAYEPRGGGPYGVQGWDEPASTVIGSASVRGSTAASVGDPRSARRRQGCFRLVRRTGAPGTATLVADPRVSADLGDPGRRHTTHFQVNDYDAPARTVTGATHVANGAACVADPRSADGGWDWSGRPGLYGVLEWEGQAQPITGSASVSSSNCPAAVADPREVEGQAGPQVPADDDQPDPPPVLLAEDGTWHRPLTTLELLALQGFPTYRDDGTAVRLSGGSDRAFRERIGNAVPPPAACAVATEILRSLLRWDLGELDMGETLVWVSPPQVEGAAARVARERDEARDRRVLREVLGEDARWLMPLMGWEEDGP